MNHFLKNIETYFTKPINKLNTNKTKSMMLGSQFKIVKLNTKNFQLNAENSTIEWVTEMNYLRLVIDNTLYFAVSSHITKHPVVAVCCTICYDVKRAEKETTTSRPIAYAPVPNPDSVLFVVRGGANVF